MLSEVELMRLMKYIDNKLMWVGGKTKAGYGRFRLNKKRYLTHRLVYEHYWGPILPEICVCHTCDIQSCCDPLHLFLGTYKDNTQDMIKKGRHRSQKKTHCPKGHKYTYSNKDGCRRCLICKRACQRESDKKVYRKHINPSPKPIPSLRTHCPQGHEYDIIMKNGWRRCRTCIRESDKNHRRTYIISNE